MIYKEQCRLCNKNFESDVNWAAKGNLSKHIKLDHNIEVSEYILNGKDWPLCACGCGNKVKYTKWKFLKYYKNHKNKVKVTNEIKEKLRNGYKRYYETHISKGKVDLSLIKKLWEEYQNNTNCNLNLIQQKGGYDKRTIKSYWWKFGITTKEEINRQARLHKFIFANQGKKNGQYCDIETNILENIFDELTEYKNTLSLNDIKLKFGISFTTHVLFKRLCEYFGKDVIKSLLKMKSSGIVSREEATFGNVLMFYFGDKNVKPQFKLKYINENNRKASKHYDFCLFNKILIEYDGNYWHDFPDAKKNDIFKNELAIKNGFIIFRINSDDAKNIEILIKIKELINEIQINPHCKN
jgi:hypothetical protein